MSATGFDLPGPLPTCDSCDLGLFLYFFDSQGRKLRDRVQVNEISKGFETAGLKNIAVGRRGDIIVTFWRSFTVFPEEFGVYVRRFSPKGDSLGPEVRVNTDVSSDQKNSVVAAFPDGEFIVVWQTALSEDLFGGIYARRFGADGRPLGASFRVSQSTETEFYPQVTVDRYGNYFINWNSFAEDGTSDVRGRLYRRDGTPVSGEFQVNQDPQGDQAFGVAAFAPNGTLLVSWQSDDFDQTNGEAMVPVIRRYAASPGQEVCAISGPQILCDLGRTGGPAELSLAWGGRPGEVTLFGDVDGDGRDDVCSYFEGSFRCDIDHEGIAANWTEKLGSPGDIPLLADVDGDGRADPCVRRGNLLLCDTKGDGLIYYRRKFGQGGEVPLLGDLDGDHKADLCLFRDGVWDCLLSTGGRIHFRFGRAGDSPALGDINNNGRAEPCVLRDGMLLCSTAHNRVADFSLPLDVPAGARLLFGNLDGL
jgi:hypothetical protein